ncbi:4Fe-4S ferredoxin [Candidatus Thorarchaeota archaeon]|nr:MAG: 4Fe-4S ferredoxin [Candidatus Thorarchaeota archaeon]
MVRRLMIQIDEELCDGCGNCVPGCAEGALQIIDGKARLVSETYCDGLGACLGECPQGALTLAELDTVEFDEEAAMEHVKKTKIASQDVGCAGAEKFTHAKGAHVTPEDIPVPISDQISNLGHWPIKLKLISTQHQALDGARLLVVADCAALAYPSLNNDFVAGKVPIIVCPKFEDGQENFNKLVEIFYLNDIKEVSVLHMEVPCCFGLSRMVAQALLAAKKTVPLQTYEIGVKGNIKKVY